MKFVAVSSCPTGIAHTYMAAEALEQAGRAAGHEVVVETQGAAGSQPLDPAVIASADGVIYAADLEVQGRDRFAGKPFVDVGVKKAVHDAPGVVAAAVAAVESAPASGSSAAPAAVATAAPATRQVGTGTRIRQYLMTGVSYMIPFVAAGGILIALGFMLASVAWAENGAIEVTGVDAAVLWTAFEWGNLQHWAVLLFQTGALAFGFLVPALSAYIAYAIADRPGIAPGFVGGSIASMVGAGFLGGIATGFLAGFVALWLARRNVPKGVRGVMPVVVIPLVATLVVGFATFLIIGPPMRAINDALTAWLNGLSGGALIPLGILLGLMMCFDLGGPVNKVAYVFATTGLINAAGDVGATEARIMAAVMAAGMVPPLAIALATALRPRVFSEAERESGKSAWLLGASFISEGAIPFAAADPVRMLPSFMVGGAVSGGLVMAVGSGVVAPHGGIWVTPLISLPLLFLLALAVGTVVSAFAVLFAKNIGRNPQEAVLDDAESLAALSGAR
jgi:fructose PTS system EIIBC or EIIC component